MDDIFCGNRIVSYDTYNTITLHHPCMPRFGLVL